MIADTTGGTTIDGGRHWRMVNAGLFNGETEDKWGWLEYVDA